MQLRSLGNTIEGPNASVVMDSGDRLSIGFRDLMGQFQVINVSIQGKIALVEHEQTQDAIIVRHNQTIFVKESK